MQVQLFTDITTEQALEAIEKEAKSYEGLYVEMDDPEQRKYVKEKARVIGDILKKLDRARIDKSKDYKARVEQEAASIRKRLEEANKPFTLLIDEYAAERKKILDAQKAKREAEEAARQLEIDHEFALLMNIQWDNDKEKREAEKAAEVKRIADEAKAQLIAEQQMAAEAEKAEKERQARINDIEHRRAINSETLAQLMTLGLSEDDSKALIRALANNALAHVTINY